MNICVYGVLNWIGIDISVDINHIGTGPSLINNILTVTNLTVIQIVHLLAST